MKKIYLSLLVCFLALGAANAQNNVSFSYAMGFGAGDVADFINQPSFRGFSFDYRNLVTPNVGVGFTVGWNVFYQESDKDSYTYGNSTLTGKQFRYSNHVPLLQAERIT